MIGIAYGITYDTSSVNDHDIGFAYNQYIIEVSSSVDGNDIWHVYGNSEKYPIFHLYTYGHESFDRVRLINPVNGQVLFNHDFSDGRLGDIWKLVP